MSSDLLAEFDSFYKSPQDSQSDPIPASNNLSFLQNPTTNGQYGKGGASAQLQHSSADVNGDVWGGISSFQATKHTHKPVIPQDDIWGTFEGSTGESEVPAARNYTPNLAYIGGMTRSGTDRNASQSNPTILRRPTLELFSSNAFDSGRSVSSTSGITAERLPHARPAAVTKSSYGEVLFDADEIENEGGDDDDDFGDFETVTAVPEPLPLAQPSPSIDFLFQKTTLGPDQVKSSLDLLSTPTSLNAGVLPYPQAPKSPSFQERNPFSELGLATTQIRAVKMEEEHYSPSPVTAWPTVKPKGPKPAPYVDSPAPNNPLDDDWGEFADMPPEPRSVMAPPKEPIGIEADAWGWDDSDQVTSRPPVPIDEPVPPPTNIPPPSMLLALFPPLFNLAQSSLFKAVAGQPFSLKNRILSDPSTIDFLRAYLLISTVAARVIAGRKLRWKRDTLLAQAMKIGPAAAGGKGGMKLTGIDRAETTREHREASEVIRVWKDNLGRLRSAVVTANSSMEDSSSQLTIPDISDTMYVKIQDGALAAPKPCIICGLKREERINKVDIQVEDSFGEWWIEHWGHRTCRNFWQEHESNLKHR